MADKSIHSNDISNEDIGERRNIENLYGGKNLQKFGTGLVDLGNDTVTSIEDEAIGIGESFIDRFKPKSLRRNGDGDDDFIIEEVSIANRHKDAISSILSDTFNGNLFDAGISALNLVNFGTKWKVVKDQYTDKNTYSFRYLHYYSKLSTNPNNTIDGFSDEDDNDSSVNRYIDLLESIEDPTVLGFSLRIDYDNSPLFASKQGNLTPSDIEEIDTYSDEDDNNFTNKQIQQIQQINEKPPKNSALEFIERYKDEYCELVMCEEYLEEFTESVKKIFEAPETLIGDNPSYRNPAHKNHYINQIKGLDKLDNYFVEYDEENSKHEALEFELGEDVRMYTNKMKFLYKNLTWSYNMGKKLIPENKLRFNLYIKVSDIRQFTSKYNKEIVEDKYSRVIYELKDCEFLFDESINPTSLRVGGFSSPNNEYATLNLKIKYRKVNRIFYSHMFANDNNSASDMYIGDKFYKPHNDKSYTDNYKDELENWKFAPDYTKQRTDKDNNIPVKQSLSERLDRLKNQGLFDEDDNDTALNRFAKGIGNEAVKSGASLVDENLQKIKNGFNDQQNGVNVDIRNIDNAIADSKFGNFLESNGINNNLVGSVRDFITGNVGKKTTDLGDLHPNGVPNKERTIEKRHKESNKEIDIPNEDVHPDGNKIIPSPNIDLHDELNQKIENPNEDLHDELNKKIEIDEIDLHPELNQKIENPNEDLHPELNEGIENPNEDLHPELNEGIENPNEDLHPELNEDITIPNEDLHPELNEKIINPNEDLHPELNEDIDNPNEDLHPDSDKTINIPNIDLHDEKNNSIENPNEDLHDEKNNIDD